MHNQEPLSILVLGDTHRSEFAAARASLDALGQVDEAASVDEVLATADADGLSPAVIVVAQRYPGEFATESLDQLRHKAPLARIVGLLGSWCEGESRTGYPWPGAIRLYWHQWIPQARRELADLTSGGASTWSLPSTANDEERLLAGSRPTVGNRAGLIVLCVERFESHDWLAAAVSRRGFSTVWMRRGQRMRLQGVRAALFDGTSLETNELVYLRRLHAGLGPAVPIIALADFPRIEDHDRAREAGAAAVLSKPLLLEDLYDRLDELTA
ncbi:MAG: hypothetical protein JW719_12785 [Pirellulales bacterium]|nr:hypothetical protein [Pirellulales bacterium]